MPYLANNLISISDDRPSSYSSFKSISKKATEKAFLKPMTNKRVIEHGASEHF